jgi:acetyl-CoA C-acetyltransferase
LAVEPRSPCIIGVGRHTWHRQPDRLAPEPLVMWEHVAHSAADDAGSPSIVEHLDAIHAVHCMSWTYDDAPGRLAARLGATPSHTETSILAGTSSQRMVNAAAERMLEGQSELALVVGGEALATKRRLLAAGEPLPWSHPSPVASEVPIDLDEWFWPTELTHEVIQPPLTFALFDTARRAAHGLSADEGRAENAATLTRLNTVATANPHAWFRTARTADEITTPSADNRMVASPYTKYMVAVMDVDMAAGLLLATHAKADELGIPADQRVYLRSWAFARDATHVAERPSLAHSPAMAVASRAVLEAARVDLDDVSMFDLYSCFASAVHFARDALELSPHDERPISLTGGLPYHGGPSSNYTAHSIAEAVVRLRSEGSGAAMVSGVGMHMTKHVWALYSPEPGVVVPPDDAALQSQVDATAPLRPVKADLSGPATVAAYSVWHGRDGTPSSALAVVELGDGTRGYARTEDADDLSALGEGEWVGATVRVEAGPDNRNRLLLS